MHNRRALELEHINGMQLSLMLVVMAVCDNVHSEGGLKAFFQGRYFDVSQQGKHR